MEDDLAGARHLVDGGALVPVAAAERQQDVAVGEHPAVARALGMPPCHGPVLGDDAGVAPEGDERMPDAWARRVNGHGSRPRPRQRRRRRRQRGPSHANPMSPCHELHGMLRAPSPTPGLRVHPADIRAMDGTRRRARRSGMRHRCRPLKMSGTRKRAPARCRGPGCIAPWRRVGVEARSDLGGALGATTPQPKADHPRHGHHRVLMRLGDGGGGNGEGGMLGLTLKHLSSADAPG